MSKVMKPCTLWSHYSMLKSTFQIKNGNNISNYPKLIVFLKNLSKEFQPKKPPILLSDNVELNEDENYLIIKVMMLYVKAVFCYKWVVYNIQIDVKDTGSLFLLTIPKTTFLYDCLY